jgi:hypothetical protein
MALERAPPLDRASKDCRNSYGGSNRSLLPEEHQPDETINVILIDPEAGSIDHVEIGRSTAAMAALVGGEAMPLMTVPGGDIAGKAMPRVGAGGRMTASSTVAA